MKTGRQALESIPLNCIIHLSNKEISEIFGIHKSTCSVIVSDKFSSPSSFVNDSKNKQTDEMELKCKGAWIDSEERKSLNL